MAFQKPMNICHIFLNYRQENVCLIHRNNICIMKKLRLMQVSVSTFVASPFFAIKLENKIICIRFDLKE